MIQPIKIETAEFVDAFAIPESEIDTFVSNVLSEVAIEYAMYWNNAANELDSSRSQYQNAIYTEKVDNLNYIVGLSGTFPNMVEQGASPFDQKENFKKSSKVKYNKKGEWYMTIPFRFSTPGSGVRTDIFAGELPSEIYSEAKGLKEKESLKKSSIPKELQSPGKRDKIVTKSKVYEEYQRKFSKYEGLRRSEDDKGRGQYTTFRRVGKNSDDNAWIHPGLEARNLSEKAFSNMNLPGAIDAIVDKYIDEL